MLDRMDAMMFQREATRVPGLLMRSHYGILEEGAKAPVGQQGKALVMHTPPSNWEDHYPLALQHVAQLPTYYKEVVDIRGKHFAVEAKWMGHASRDTYVRSLLGILLAYDLLGQGEREERLRHPVRRLVPCTLLNRLKKMRVRNIQSNDEGRKAITSYLWTENLQPEEGDLDLWTLETLHAFLMEEPRPGVSAGSFDPTWPDGPPMELDPAYALDATADNSPLWTS